MSRPIPGLLARAVVVSAALLMLAGAARAAELLYVHDPSCVYCREWERVIGPVYPKTAEAKIAPLRPMLIEDVPRAGLVLARPVRYTPTFVLLETGREVGRIEGYPGEELFWMRLEQLLDRLGPREPPKLGGDATRIDYRD